MTDKHGFMKHHPSSGSWKYARWLLALLFPAGWFLTREVYPGADYLLYTGVSTFAYLLLASRLGPSLSRTLPVWIILGTFLIGYYLQFYWLTWELKAGLASSFSPIVASAISNQGLMWNSYVLTTYAFLAFTFGSVVVLGAPNGKPSGFSHYLNAVTYDSSNHEKTRRQSSASVLLYYAVILVMAATAVLQYRFGLGVYGAAPVALPFALTGAIVYSRTVTIPILLVFLIWTSDVRNYRLGVVSGITLLIVHGFVQMILMSSRGQLVLLLIPMFLVWVLTGRVRGARLRILILIALLTLIFVPIITDFRSLRADSSDPTEVLAPLTRASESNTVSSLLRRGVITSLVRVQGIPPLAMSVDYASQTRAVSNLRYYLANRERSFARIYTEEVANIHSPYHLSVPGLLGSFYLLAGRDGLILGALLWVVFWQLIWAASWAVRLYTKPIVLSYLALLIVLFSSEGDIDTIPFRLSLYAANFLLIEMLYRLFFTEGRKARRMADPAARGFAQQPTPSGSGPSD